MEIAAPRFAASTTGQDDFGGVDFNSLQDLFFQGDDLFSGLTQQQHAVALPAEASSAARAAFTAPKDVVQGAVGSGPDATGMGGGSGRPGKRRKTEKGRSTEQIEKRRERNRILARRTRLRKKFFFESLQRQVVELQRENMMLKEVVRTQMSSEKARELLDECNTTVPEIVSDSTARVTEVLQKSDFQLMKVLQNAQQSFVVTDPQLPDNPIVYASKGFLDLTGYSQAQVLGRNCRFLQGDKTDPKRVEIIRAGIAAGVDTSVCLLNYRADGSTFWNQFFVAALRDVNRRVVNFVGVQCELKKPPPEDEEFMAALEARRALRRSVAEHQQAKGASDQYNSSDTGEGDGEEDAAQED